MGLGLAALAPRGGRAAPSAPNILFVLADDQRADYLGCSGHPV